MAMSDTVCLTHDSFHLRQHSDQDTFQGTGGSQAWARNMAHSYCEGNCKVVGHFTFRLGEEICDFIAIVERLVGPNGPGDDLRDCPSEANLPGRVAIVGDLYQTVLVNIIEGVEKGHDGRKFGVPSIVRLFTFDELLGFLRQGCDSASLAVEIFRRVTQGKLQNAGLGEHSVGAFQGQCIDQMVQGAAQILGAIPRNKSEPFKISGPSNFKDETVAARIRLELFDNAIRLTVEPLANFTLEGLQVFFSPVDFQA